MLFRVPTRKGLYIFHGLVILLVSVFGSVTIAAERITHFNSDILVRPDRILLVTETISVIAETAAIRHGIYREFPTIYPHSRWGSLGFKEKTGFSIVSIKLDGADVPWIPEQLSNGIRFYIGNPNTYVSRGQHVYEIQYTTTRQIARHGSSDLLNWNVNGQGWTFPTERITAIVRLSGGEIISDYTAWTGVTGSEEVAYESRQGPNGTLHFNTTRTLRPFEGLTISLQLPEGLLQAPQKGPLLFIKSNFKWIVGLLLLLAMPIYYLRAWSRVGRDPQKGVVVADYHPVHGLSAAAHHFILNNKVNNQTFTAAILAIAVKGYIRIEQKSGKVYTIHMLPDAVTKAQNSELSPGEAIVLDALFKGGEKSVTLDGKYSRAIANGKKQLAKYLKSEWRDEIYKQNHHYTWKGLLIGLVSLIFCGLHLSNTEVGFNIVTPLLIFFMAAVALTQDKLRPFVFSGAGLFLFSTMKNVDLSVFSLPAMISLSVLVAVLFGVFYVLLKAPTPFGRKILDEIEGFRLYLATAEQHRLNILHPPEKTPALFEQLLPYAIALGVENRWSDQFAAVFRKLDKKEKGYSPGWYRGSSNTRFSSSRFASGLGAGLSSSIASASTAPSSSSGGGMSGGSAGGGGGGGGGGGW